MSGSIRLNCFLFCILQPANGSTKKDEQTKQVRLYWAIILIEVLTLLSYVFSELHINVFAEANNSCPSYPWWWRKQDGVCEEFGMECGWRICVSSLYRVIGIEFWILSAFANFLRVLCFGAWFWLIFIWTNICFNLSSKAFFSSAGDVKEVRLAMDGEGQFRGFGHVEFNTEDGANKVWLACLRVLKINWATAMTAMSLRTQNGI